MKWRKNDNFSTDYVSNIGLYRAYMHVAVPFQTE